MELDQIHEGVGRSLSNDRNLEGTRQLADAATQTRETAAQQRRASALRMGSLATAGHHAAADLEEHFPQVARYVHDAAAGFEHISNFLRDPNLDEVATFIGSLGRKQPAAVIAGVFLVAMGLSWFLRSSGDSSDGIAADDRERGAYDIH
jgi:hypothetical protein